MFVRPPRLAALSAAVLVGVNVSDCKAADAPMDATGTYGAWVPDWRTKGRKAETFLGVIVRQRADCVSLFYRDATIYNDFSSFMYGHRVGDMLSVHETVTVIGEVPPYRINDHDCTHRFLVSAKSISLVDEHRQADDVCLTWGYALRTGLQGFAERKLKASIEPPRDAAKFYHTKAWRDGFKADERACR